MSEQVTYDHALERRLIEAIAVAEVSGVTDANAVMIRPGETARALTRTLGIVLALSPAVARSPTALRKTSDEIGKVLRRYVAENERNGIAQEFLARTFRGDVAGNA